MAVPLIELRIYHRLFTMDDLRRGATPQRDPTPPHEIYTTPVFQYRYAMKVMDGTRKGYDWSDWIDVPAVREERSKEDAEGDVAPL